jgi:hypothetical protein
MLMEEISFNSCTFLKLKSNVLQLNFSQTSLNISSLYYTYINYLLVKYIVLNTQYSNDIALCLFEV